MSKPRVFSLRLPQELYLAVNDLAVTSGRTQNATVIELIEIGLGRQLSVRTALERLIEREFPTHAVTVES